MSRRTARHDEQPNKQGNNRMMAFPEWQGKLNAILESTVFTVKTGSVLTIEQGCAALLNLARAIMENSKRLYFIGNGASASMASHIAADMGKNGKLKTDVFTDLALLTAIVNDLGSENIFAAPLRTQAHPGDALVVISSSGNSPNLIRAVNVAYELKLQVATFTAMAPDNSLRQSGDINVWVPADTYGHAESAHAAILHYWVDNVIEHFTENHLL